METILTAISTAGVRHNRKQELHCEQPTGRHRVLREGGDKDLAQHKHRAVRLELHLHEHRGAEQR